MANLKGVMLQRWTARVTRAEVAARLTEGLHFDDDAVVEMRAMSSYTLALMTRCGGH
jgi:hypothetical protein